MNHCKNAKNKPSSGKKALQSTLRILGITLCVLLALVLVFNCVLIISSAVHPDDVPSIGNYSPLIVLTESMDPDIKAGDLILCRRIDADEAKKLEVDTVISFFDPEEGSSAVVTHKIVEVITNAEGDVFYKTKGVNNIIEDRLAVSSENVIGVYTGIRFAFIGRIVMFAQTPVGLIVFIAVPVLLFLGVVLFQRRDNKKKVAADLELAASVQEVDRLRAEVEALRQEQLKQALDKMPQNPSSEDFKQLLDQLSDQTSEKTSKEDSSPKQQ